MSQSDSYKSSIFFLSIRRPVSATMIVLTVVVFGFLSYKLLPINMMPDISYPSLTIRTEYPGAAPEEVESAVVRPLEQSLGVVRNLVEMSSSSRAEVGDILLEFEWETDMNIATQDVREKLDLVFLEDNVKSPLILRYDPSLDPIMRVGFTSDSLSLLQLRELIERIVEPEIEKLPGVAAVKVKGGNEAEVHIAVDADVMHKLHIDFDHIRRRLISENINIAGGRLSEGENEYIIRTLNEYQSIEDISSTIIFQNADRTIKLSDIATISRKGLERTNVTRMSAKENVEIEIHKEADANPVIVAQNVRDRIFEKPERNQGFPNLKGKKERKRNTLMKLEESLTDRVNISILSDQSTFIESAINQVRSAALIGGLLAVAVLFLFLGKFKDTLIVGLIIPISLVCTFAAMHLAGVSLNIMSLGGLALGIGMMVDNGIVVIESIYRRRESGAEIEDAAVTGTRVVGGAVTASTLTTVVVFLPIIFVTGVAGQIFGDMAITVIISLITSLMLALFFLPMLLTRITYAVHTDRVALEWGFTTGYIKSIHSTLKASFVRWYSQKGWKVVITGVILPILILIRYIISLCFYLIALLVYISMIVSRWFYNKGLSKLLRKSTDHGNRIARLFRLTLQVIETYYQRLLRGILRNPLPNLLLVFCFCALPYYFLYPLIGKELIPKFSQGVFEVELTLPVGTTLEKTSQISLPIEEAIMSAEYVDIVSSRIGGDLKSADRSARGTHNSVITVLLEPGGDLEQKEERVVDLIRSISKNIPALELNITHPTLFTLRKPVEVIIKGDNLKSLNALNTKVKEKFSKLPFLKDMISSVKTGHPEVIVRFNRERLMKLGLNPRQTAETIRNTVQGTVPTKYREDERRINVTLQYEEEDRKQIQDLENIIVNPKQKIPVRLKDIAFIEQREGPAEIRRISGIRSAVISSDIEDIELDKAKSSLNGILEEMGLTDGYDYFISGQFREMESSLASLKFALFLAIFLVYVVMASQFESLLHPLIILLTIPLALSGVIFALFITGLPLSIMAFLGSIVLTGIVVNNSIVLVDYGNQIRRKGKSVNEAIIEAGVYRLRPIIMTSLTTILALMPMTLGVGEGVELRRPMATTVVFGLAFATLISLIVIPMLYSFLTKEQSMPYPSADG